MKSSLSLTAASMALLFLSGCVVVPTGPGVMAMPGKGKTFEQFRSDDAECRQFATGQSGGADANQAAISSGVTSAAIGTAVGALAGAALGGHNGAAVGAGGGLLLGSAVGANTAQTSAHLTQRSYDNAYIQCMYAKGESVPVPGYARQTQTIAPPPVYAAPAPQTVYVAPPPPPVYVTHAPVIVEQPPIVYVTPSYARPGVDWIWEFHPRYGWGWHHSRYGWHRHWHD